MALPVALAFADASIVLLALPEIVARLGTSISSVVWVLVVYNLALIAGSLAIRFAPTRFPVEPLLVVGLLVFGAASLAAGMVSTITGLLIARGVQGVGGAMLLCASLPPMARAAGIGDASPLRTWSAAAATGAALGPAAVYFLCHLLEGELATPALVGHRLTTSPLLVFLSFAFDGERIVRSIDISVGGVRFATPAGVTVGERIELTVLMPRQARHPSSDQLSRSPAGARS